MKLITFLVAFIPFVCLSQSVPPDVTEILTKLQSYEEEQYSQAENAVKKKQAEVAQFLKTALERETRNGNLDGALAIKKEIERLSIETKRVTESKSERSNESKGPVEFKMPVGVKLEEWLEEVEFVQMEGRNELIRFFEDDTIFTVRNGKVIGADASIRGNRIIWLYPGDNKTEFSITLESMERGFATQQNDKHFECVIRPRTNKWR